MVFIFVWANGACSVGFILFFKAQQKWGLFYRPKGYWFDRVMGAVLILLGS